MIAMMLAITAACLNGYSGDEVLASYSDKTVTSAQFVKWTETYGVEPSDQALLEMIFFHEMIAAAKSAGTDQSDRFAAAFAARELSMRSNWFDRHMRSKVTVSADEIARAVAENPDALNTAEKRTLSGIFKQYTPDSEQNKTIRDTLETVRSRAVNGEDFGTLAMMYSDSQSRFRDGKLGRLDVDALPDPVRTAVAVLDEGGFSPVIEYSNGAGFFFCEKIHPAQSISSDEVEKRFRNYLHRKKLAERKIALIEQLKEENPDQQGDTLLATYALSLPVMQSPSYKAAVEASRDRLLVTSYLESMARNAVAVSEEEIQQAYQSRKDKLFEPRKYRLQAIRFGTLKGADSPELLARAREVAALLESGDLSFDDAAAKHASDTIRDSWLSSRQLIDHGPWMTRALKKIEPGSNTGLIRLETGLWWIQLLDVQDIRPQTIEEARPTLEKELFEAAVKEERIRFRAQYIRNLNITLYPEVLALLDRPARESE